MFAVVDFRLDLLAWFVRNIQIKARQKYRALSGGLLFLLANSLVWLSILVHIYKLSGVGVTFHPLFSFRIEYLRTFLNSTIAVAVSGFSVFCHDPDCKLWTLKVCANLGVDTFKKEG